MNQTAANFVSLIGIAGIIWSFNIPTTPPGSGTLNIGLMQDQMMVLHTSIAILLIGAIFSAAGMIKGK
jgi:hypothetical protein